MPNLQNFTINDATLQEAITALQAIPQKYSDALAAIKAATEPLLEKENWKGEARDEFKATYRILEHYLEDDQERTSNIVDILIGFRDIYKASDVETAKKLVDKTVKAVKTVTGKDES